MDDKIQEFIAEIDEKELEQFLKKIHSSITVQTEVEKVISDTSWISMIEESIPYLDDIIRNPRRFIMQEENIVPIEKAKVVTEESIKHLAQNTKLIQDVDEDDNVVPLKLLNVYREETVDLYENRFIKSLVDNLYSFVNDKLSDSDQQSYGKVTSKVMYNCRDNINNEVIEVNMNLITRNNQVISNKSKGLSLEDRIANIKAVLADFMSSKFIKNLKDCQAVRSPIRKTNVILKEQNFVKALELWEYLEANSVKPITTVEKEIIDRSYEAKEKFDVALFLQTKALEMEGKEKNRTSPKTMDYIAKLVSDVIVNNKVTESELKKIISKEYQAINKKKKKQEESVKKCFEDVIKAFEKRRQKAINIIK